MKIALIIALVVLGVGGSVIEHNAGPAVLAMIGVFLTCISD